MSSENSEIYTVSEVRELINERINCINSYYNKNDIFVGIKGILGYLPPPSNYPSYYMSLRDANKNSISLSIPKSLGDIKAYQQKEVIVHGLIKAKLYNNNLSFSIEVSRINPVVKMSQEVKEQETKMMELISSHQRDLRPFPDLDTYSITVLHGMSSQVKDDFERQLGQDESIKIKYVPLNITSTESLKQGLESVQGDIIVVIRGGGSEEQFEVFNNFELVKVWINKDAYKISALGHTKNRTLFDTFASWSCDTPTDAGAFIRRSIDALKAVKKIEALTAQHKKDIEEINKNYTNKIEELQKAKDADIKALNEKASKEKDELNKKIEALNKEFAEKFEEIQKKKDAEVKELNEKIEKASKEKEEILKDKEIKVLSKEEEIKSLLSKLAVKDTHVKVSLAITILSIIGLIVALIKLL